MSLVELPVQAVIVPRRAIGTFNATVTIEEVATDELEITQHPVQQGASITDHAYLKPASVSIKFLFDAQTQPLADTYRQLRELQAGREPFDVITGKRQYKNMLCKSLSQTNDRQNENVLSITAQLQEILITAVTVGAVGARRKHKMPGKTGATENAGAKNVQEVDPSKVSAFKKLLQIFTGK